MQDLAASLAISVLWGALPVSVCIAPTKHRLFEGRCSLSCATPVRSGRLAWCSQLTGFRIDSEPRVRLKESQAIASQSSLPMEVRPSCIRICWKKELSPPSPQIVKSWRNCPPPAKIVKIVTVGTNDEIVEIVETVTPKTAVLLKSSKLTAVRSSQWTQ